VLFFVLALPQLRVVNPEGFRGSSYKRIFFISNYGRFCQSMGKSVTYFAVRSPTSMVL